MQPAPRCPPPRCAPSYRLSLFFQTVGVEPCSQPLRGSQKVKMTKANLIHEVSERCLLFLLVFPTFYLENVNL